MFEQLTPDLGQQGLERAARTFYVLAILNLLAILAAFVAYAARPRLLVFMVVASIISAVLAAVVARGLEARKRWAPRAGVTVAALTALNFPVGTVLGVVTLVYLKRATGAGVFRSQPDAASGDDPAAAAFSVGMPGCAITGGLFGFIVFLGLIFVAGRPDSYLEKFVILAGGGAAAGAIFGMFSERRN